MYMYYYIIVGKFGDVLIINFDDLANFWKLKINNILNVYRPMTLSTQIATFTFKYHQE